MELSSLKVVCEVLGVQRSGNKEQIVMRLLEFCMNPADAGLAPGAGSKKSKTSSPRKSSKSSPKKSQKGKAVPKVAIKPKKRKLGSDEDGDGDSETEETPRKRSRDGPTRTASTGKTYQVYLRFSYKLNDLFYLCSK